MTHSHRRAVGFTLIELIVTIAILTLLAGVLVPTISNYVDKSKKAKSATELNELARVFTAYDSDCSAWPANTDLPTASLTTASFAITSMPCLYANVFTKTGWDGPYLSKGVMSGSAMNIATASASGSAAGGLLDAWGNPYYCYTFASGYITGSTGALVLLSRGSNGVADTSVANIYAGTPASDDVIQIVTYKP